ncbi:hypothetical protein NIES4106_38210 [Fischerella sp. NIES-4106]|nr:hypothetical protein NIES4106_38210 [Fischerella sp. NIES-4106]
MRKITNVTDYSSQDTEQTDLSVGSIPFYKIVRLSAHDEIQNPKSIDQQLSTRIKMFT